jgi:lysyl-tRNA synthetase class I
MEYSQVVELEEKLLELLRQEYSFYQSLYLLIDKQRDHLRFERDQKLLDLYDEIEQAEKRILESEEKIGSLRNANRKIFNLAATSPEIKKLVTSIATLIKKNLAIIRENEDFASNKRTRILEELEQVKRMYKALAYKKPPQETRSKIIDGTG